jgi:hypothetical protein
VSIEETSAAEERPTTESSNVEKGEKEVEIVSAESPTVNAKTPVANEGTFFPARKRGRPSLNSVSNKSVKIKVVDAKPLVEALGIDVLSNKRLLAFNRLDRQALAFGSTVKEKGRQNSSKKTLQYSCGLCHFDTDSSDEFQTHIRIHKPVVIKGVVKMHQASNNSETGKTYDDEDNEEGVPAECFQCKECGMCFATEPSWKKHLFLLHRIKNPGPEHYCEGLKSTSTSGPFTFYKIEKNFL